EKPRKKTWMAGTSRAMTKLSPQECKIDLPVIELRQQCQHGPRASVIPTAMAGVACKFFLDIDPRERLLRAAAEMRLALLDDTAVVEHRANVAGEIVGIRIVGIDLVAHFRGEREHVLVAYRGLGERVETDAASDETRCDQERCRELGGIAVGRMLLGGERLP